MRLFWSHISRRFPILVTWQAQISPGSLQHILVEQLYMCVEFLWKSERYELIADVNKPIITVFEKQRDFKVYFLDLEMSWNLLLETDKLQLFKIKALSDFTYFFIDIYLTYSIVRQWRDTAYGFKLIRSCIM